MNLLYFVEERLEFIRYFYETAARAFEETKRQIEEGEEPYEPDHANRYEDEPPFLEEWEDADAAAIFAGAACLDLLQSSFHSFLHQYMREIGGAHLISRLRDMKKGNWLSNYRELFRQQLGIEWERAGLI